MGLGTIPDFSAPSRLLNWVSMYRSLAALLLCAAALRADSVLVVPFFNQSNNPNLDWIGESIAESVQDSLASEGVLVLNRDERLEGYRRLSLRPGAQLTHASIIKLGMALDAAEVIYGSFEAGPPAPGSAPAGGATAKASLRIMARVLNLKHPGLGPEFGEAGALEDLAVLEVHLGWQSLTQIAPQSAPSESDFRQARPPVRIDAVENYIRGLLASNPDQRQHFFMQAARLDEHFSQPCFQLGKTYWSRDEYKLAAGWFSRVSRSDPHYLEAQFFLGLCRFDSGDFAAAETAFQTVAVSVPLNEVFNNLGAAEARRGNLEAAIANFNKAVDGDSSDPDYQFNLGYAYWRSREYSAAAERFRAALERDPSDTEAIAMLGRALQGEGARAADSQLETRLRLKEDYEEDAYRQLQAELKK
ncbi:MAG: tetratricopeptide repeat protein, partial [Bryobacteraceae bacterium]